MSKYYVVKTDPTEDYLQRSEVVMLKGCDPTEYSQREMDAKVRAELALDAAKDRMKRGIDP
jgi:hypothetical protein